MEIALGWSLNGIWMLTYWQEAVTRGNVRFVPENWRGTYKVWLNHIQPWCISRQLWWGHQIPAWYGPDNHTFVADNLEEAQAQAQFHCCVLRP